ncbi:MAG: hypothetical protein PHO23_00315 [Candidatus Pacebacteria bacterium]|nr:hypothetical protein [Candidatus Paceibacterota bacterium]
MVTNDDTCSPISNPIAGIFHNPALLYTIDIARYGDGVDLDYLDFHQIITNHSSFGVLMYENVHWSKNSNYSGTVLNYKCDASSQRCFPRHDGQFTDLAECNSLCAASQSAEPPYTCSGSQCVIADPQPGQYSTVEECVTACDIAPPAGANACTNFYYSDDNKVCQSENISFGDSISLNNVGLSGYMISQTFDFEKPTSILAYSLEGEFDPALVKIQFDCKDDIVDASGVMISDEA